jgi:hypothetical protein
MTRWWIGVDKHSIYAIVLEQLNKNLEGVKGADMSAMVVIPFTQEVHIV